MNKAHNNNWIFLFDFFPCLLLAFSTPSWDEPPPRSPPVHNPSIVVCCIDKHTPVSSILFFLLLYFFLFLLQFPPPPPSSSSILLLFLLFIYFHSTITSLGAPNAINSNSNLLHMGPQLYVLRVGMRTAASTTAAAAAATPPPLLLFPSEIIQCISYFSFSFLCLRDGDATQCSSSSSRAVSVYKGKDRRNPFRYLNSAASGWMECPRWWTTAG